MGSGKGGNITITDTTTISFNTNYQPGFISAQGGPTGAGGTITMPSVQNFYVPPSALLLVNAGAQSNVSVQDGTLVLNGQTCGQWKIGNGTGNVTWPLTYWDCVNPTNPTANPLDQIQQSVATTLVGTPRGPQMGTSIGNVKTNIFVFGSGSNWDIFYGGSYQGHSMSQSDGGYTFYYTYTPSGGGNAQTYVVSSVAENANQNVNGQEVYGPLSTLQMKENSAHELGHALDISTGLQLSGFYNSQINTDVTNLNNDNGNGGANPCSKNNSAPYDQVIDVSSGLAFCNPATGLLNNNNYNNLSNNAIATTSDGELFNTAYEMFAQSFSWALVLENLPPPWPWAGFYQTTADGLFANGYYSCAVSYANYTINGTADSCTVK
jgi:hypothetical protein